jgi:hypothetical protein
MSYPQVPEKRNESDLLLSKEIDINAPMDVVFMVLTDFDLFVDLEEPVRSITITSEIKEGQGLKSHWLLIDPDTGGEWTLDEEIIYYDQPRQYAYVGHGSNGKDYTGVHNLSENPDGSTHVLFNEAFHFEANPDVYGEILDTLLANVKKEAEKRAGNL